MKHVGDWIAVEVASDPKLAAEFVREFEELQALNAELVEALEALLETTGPSWSANKRAVAVHLSRAAIAKAEE